MIASIYGKLETLNTGSIILNVNGIGFLVHVPASTLSTLGSPGREVRLLTQMVVREDSMNLYGFATENELELFKILTSVSGLGSKLALAMLSSLSVEQISTAIVYEKIDLLVSIPGIGKKTANRLVLELKDKISAGLLSVPGAMVAADNAEVIAALTSLGYSLAEASRAAASLPSTGQSLEEKITAALQYFTG